MNRWSPPSRRKRRTRSSSRAVVNDVVTSLDVVLGLARSLLPTERNSIAGGGAGDTQAADTDIGGGTTGGQEGSVEVEFSSDMVVAVAPALVVVVVVIVVVFHEMC